MDNIHACFEPLVGIVRVYEADKNFPDPYRWTITCRFIDLETVEVLGTNKPPTKTDWLAVLESLAEIGVKKVFYRQYKDGKLRVRKCKMRT